MECAMATQTRGRKRRLVLRIEEEPGPTPETKAKLRPDRLQELFAKGLVDDQQRSAAEEIREIIDAISALYLRSGGMEMGGGSSRPRHWLDGMAPRLQRLHRTRYMPWVHAMEQQKFNGLTWLQIVVGIVIDCHAVEDYPDGVVGALKQALDAY